jgi:hypothetical protein
MATTSTGKEIWCSSNAKYGPKYVKCDIKFKESQFLNTKLLDTLAFPDAPKFLVHHNSLNKTQRCNESKICV